MPEHFALGDRVTWLTPTEKTAWEREYERLLRLYGPGPFTVEAIVSAPAVPHPQRLVLRSAAGVIEGTRAPQLFCGSWLKKTDEKGHLRAL